MEVGSDFYSVDFLKLKFMKKIFLLLVLFSLLSCEKDDICAEDTTSKLVIEFYNNDDRTELRSVSNMKVIADGETDSLIVFTGNKLSIPLRITADQTKYSFTINSTDTTFANEDLIEINYSREDIYVSRACGYKTVFELASTNPFVASDAVSVANQWIKDIDIETTTIDNENEVHVKIYF